MFEFCRLYEEEGMGMLIEKEDIPLSVVPLSERFTICTDPVPGTNLLAIWYGSNTMPTQFIELFLYFI